MCVAVFCMHFVDVKILAPPKKKMESMITILAGCQFHFHMVFGVTILCIHTLCTPIIDVCWPLSQPQRLARTAANGLRDFEDSDHGGFRSGPWAMCKNSK